jgi:DNA-directed RNA polymerase subunit RPC12/RpoP
MSQRSQSVQTDPVRRRLGRPVVARDVTCPNCGYGYATEILWQMHCPNCSFRWIDRSSRTVIDEIRDNLPSAIWALSLAACTAFAAYVALAIVAATVGRFGERSLPVGLFIFACAASIISLGVLRNRRHTQKWQRQSPWQPESGFEIPLFDNLGTFGPGGIVALDLTDPDSRDVLPEDDY